MKRFSKLIYFLILALFILSLSGCGSHTPRQYGNNNSSSNNSTENDNNDTNESDESGNNEENTGNGGSNNNSGSNATTGGSATITTETREGFEGTVTKIVLSTASTANVAALSINNYVWNVTPERGEYWTDPDGNILDDEDDVQNEINTDSSGVYIARDIRYIPDTLTFSETKVNKEQNGQDTCYVSYYSTEHEDVDTANKYILAALPTEYNGQQNVSLSTIKAAMTHSAEDAYNNPVLHITKKGTYVLSGTWNGQIWVDIPDYSTTSDTKTKKDPEAQVVLILDGLEVNCDVAPALVFKKVFQCSGDIDDESEVSDFMGSQSTAFGIANKLADGTNYYAGAVVLIADGSENTFTGTNVARLNNVEINDDYEDDANAESYIGQFVKAQDKMYKLDSAFHSRMSMVIGLEDGATSGKLEINSDYEGLDSELHMLIESGNVKVTANDDGINVNEDNISVFTQTGGALTITSTYGDGIDSNGHAVFGYDKTTVLNITAGNQSQNSAGEAGVDAEGKVYGLDDITYNHTANNNGGGNFPGGNENGNGNQSGSGGNGTFNMGGFNGETPPEPPSN